MIATISSPASEPRAAAGPTGDFVLSALLSRPYPAVMGVLNVTPDSFSDGGQFALPERALTQARRMVARPYGSEPISAEEEVNRLREVLPAVVSLGIPVSIDSMKSSVVAWAFDRGARIANDVWGLQRDPAMAVLVAARRAPIVIMHNRERADPAIDTTAAGISPANIVLDPGIGFGKTPEQSMTVLARLDEFAGFGPPLLIGASRKRFISTVTPSEPQQRLGGSIAAHLVAAVNGARIIRAHDVAETVQALRVAAAIREFGKQP